MKGSIMEKNKRTAFAVLFVWVPVIGRRRVKTEDAPCLPHGHSPVLHSEFCCADRFIGIPEAFFCHRRRTSFQRNSIFLLVKPKDFLLG